MGYEYYVYAWREDVGDIYRGVYRWFLICEGEDRADALAAMDDAVNSGDQCVKLEWRP